MPQMTIQIDERQEKLILDAIRTGKDFYIDGGRFNDNGRTVEFSKIRFEQVRPLILEEAAR